MKNLFLFVSYLLVSVASGMLCATEAPVPNTMIPAMVVTLTDGNQYVVPLEDTAVTDLTVLLLKEAGLNVRILEEDVSGVRSLTFAMVPLPDDPTAVEDSPVQSAYAIAEKVLIGGKVYLRIQMPEGQAMYYDITGKSVKLSVN